MKRNSNRGVVLIAAYLIIVVLLILGAAFIIRSLVETRSSDAQRNLTQALNIAEAGLEESLYHLRQDFLTGGASPSWIDGTINTITGITLPDPGNQNRYYNLLSGTLDNGVYLTSIKYVFSGSTAQPDQIWIKSEARVADITKTIQEYATIQNLSAWDNTIFAGSGASGSAISGNVSINGSVHILGTGLNHDDAAIDISGTGSIGDNYEGMPVELSSRIPLCPRVNFNGELVDSLGTEVRVKNGRVDISGAASIGQTNIMGNTYKETVDGIYLDVGNYDGDDSGGIGTFYDGFGGNKGTTGVNSDNGTTHSYDMGNTVTFPSLSDPYLTYPSYQAYLSAESLHVNESLIGTINSSTANFNYSNAKGSIDWNQATQELTIDGIVYLDPAGGETTSDLSLGNKGATIEYIGQGSIFVSGDIDVHGDLLSQNIFPATDALGLMAGNNINLATGEGDAQLNMIGVFYAENQVTSAKQNQIAGTFVSNYFDLGSNVPKIYQVPSLADNLPPGLPGGNTANWVLITRGWQEL